MLKYKIVLAGAKDVGKSSLIARFCDNIFNENMMATIGVSFKSKIIELNEKLSIQFNIWDFAGEERFRTLFPPYVGGASAALVLYDTTKKETINDVKNWVEIIDNHAEDEDFVKILIGTKIDLKDQREITRDDAEKTCTDLDWSAEIIETSAKTGENVEEAFIKVAKEIVNRKLQTCKHCGDVFPKQAKFCNYCGKES